MSEGVDSTASIGPVVGCLVKAGNRNWNGLKKPPPKSGKPIWFEEHIFTNNSPPRRLDESFMTFLHFHRIDGLSLRDCGPRDQVISDLQCRPIVPERVSGLLHQVEPDGLIHPEKRRISRRNADIHFSDKLHCLSLLCMFKREIWIDLEHFGTWSSHHQSVTVRPRAFPYWQTWTLAETK